MTAVAKLRDLAASWRREADDMERAGVSPSTTLAIRANADELEAALSPAELGGVPEAVAIEPNGLVMRGGIAAIGDYAIEKSPGCTRIVNAEFARGWNEARALALSTPRAAEAVSEEMVEAFARVYWKGDWPFKPDTEANRELIAEFRDVIKRGLTAALLTPPSAKGECK